MCQKCGKELVGEAVVCPGCGCILGTEKDTIEASYEQAVKGAFTTNIISVAVMVFGILLGLFVSIWFGAVLIF